MKRLLSALILSASTLLVPTVAEATNNGRPLCPETPENPHGQCPTPPPAPPQNNNRNNQQQNNSQQQSNSQQVGVGVGVGVHNTTQVGVQTGPTNVGVRTGDTNVRTGDTNVRTGDTNVRTGDTNLTDNSRTEQTVVDNSRTQQTVIDGSQNNSSAQASGNNVNFNSVYKAAANRAAPDAAAVIGDGTCKTGISLSLGVGTLDTNVGGSVAFNTGWNKECAAHELHRLEKAADADRENALRRSDDPLDRALAHEQARQNSAAYDSASVALESRINDMAKDGKPVEVGKGEWHKLGGFNLVVKQPKPTVVTVTAPAPAAAAPADCSAVIAQFVEYAKAMNQRPAARSSAKPAAVPAPVVDTCKPQVDAALKAHGVQLK
ncbi:MAG: hypothetical protein HYS17_03805 [Micavibrio aeruginosavorus]|uniref:Uncharacterized protein n=1 Tax=Micavibrio aeruginosavorus TaxID=349221 RepID=A0A7T5UIE2_9BACT|nr:MAG: hypothetical protein HYS17_03805 [Micavibrio aeruginosavorus]